MSIITKDISRSNSTISIEEVYDSKTNELLAYTLETSEVRGDGLFTRRVLFDLKTFPTIIEDLEVIINAYKQRKVK